MGRTVIATSTHPTRLAALTAAHQARAWQGYQSASVIDCGGVWLLSVRLAYPVFED